MTRLARSNTVRISNHNAKILVADFKLLRTHLINLTTTTNQLVHRHLNNGSNMKFHQILLSAEAWLTVKAMVTEQIQLVSDHLHLKDLMARGIHLMDKVILHTVKAVIHHMDRVAIHLTVKAETRHTDKILMVNKIAKDTIRRAA